MPKAALAVLPLLLLAGCNGSNPRNSRLEFELTPADAGHTAIVSCQDSSSGSCHFLFKQGAKVVSNVNVETGTTLAVRDLPLDAQYCGSVTSLGLADCALQAMPSKRVRVKMATTV